MGEHLGHDKHERVGPEPGNSRQLPATPATASVPRGAERCCGEVDIEVPRDRDVSLEPVIVKKRQRRLSEVDEVVLSLYAKGLTTGETSAHFAEVYSAWVSIRTTGRRQQDPPRLWTWPSTFISLRRATPPWPERGG